MAGSKEELKSLLMSVRVESEKAGLKLSIQKTKIMAYSPITSWQTDGEKMETVTDFILGGSKVTVDGGCSHEIKRHLLLERNLDSVLKSRYISLLIKFCTVKTMIFPVIMYVRAGPQRRLSAEELLLSNCGAKKTLENPLDCKEIKPVNPKGN